ncbi:MAG: ribbon-helix-helix domain-containing protein [Steroidobacteraceae bacterium]|nr:ribbon-helix-helix domain-containing protein [Steroidobacteraceae bacterium]
MPQKKDRSKRVFTGVYFDRAQHDALRALSDRTRVPLAAYLREAVDMLLDKYGARASRARTRPPRTQAGQPLTGRGLRGRQDPGS